MELRDYQQNAIAQIYTYFRNNDGNPVLEAPTGSGKTVIQAKFVEGVLTQWQDQRILLLTHQKELIAQNAETLLRIWPKAPVGVYSASLKRRDTSEPILLAGIQSVHNRAAELGRFDLIIVDEAHRIPQHTAGMYRKFIDAMVELNPALKVLGLTATPYRLNGGRLDEGKSRLFTDIIPARACGMDMDRLIELGHLSPLVSPAMDVQLDTDDIKQSGGDYAMGALEQSIENQSDITEAACREVVALGADRKSWLVFATSVAHAHEIHALMVAADISAAVVTGTTKQRERDQLLEQYKAGAIRCLINVNVLTTGFDAPQTDLLACLRPTLSTSLYVQMVGRGSRIAPDKDDCLVLDFAGLIKTHGPVNRVKIKKPKANIDGEAPGKSCPECHMFLHAACTTCRYCGHIFPAPKPKINTASSRMAILDDDKPVPMTVSRWEFAPHFKTGKPPSVRVDYYSGLSLIASEWLCLFHTGYAKTKALQWVATHSSISNADFEAAMDSRNCEKLSATLPHIAKKPDKLFVSLSGQYAEIVSRSFDD